MARCEICQKAGQSGNNVSYSKRRTKRRWAANVQNMTLYEGRTSKKVRVCTRCLRTHYKQR